MSGIIEKLKTSSLYDAIAFVLPAVSDDETRYFMNGVVVERETIKKREMINLVATDGRRCHIATVSAEALDTDKLPESGIWKIEKTQNGFVFVREVEGQFPNYKRIVPKIGPTKQELELSAYKRKDLGAMSQSLIKFLVTAKVIFNLSYLFDLCDGTTYSASWNEDDRSKPEDRNYQSGYFSKGIRFDADVLGYHRTAVIMPMQATD